jgi:5'-nucleotidase, C-terminal domain
MARRRRAQQVANEITSSIGSAQEADVTQQDDLLQVLHFVFTEARLLSSSWSFEECQEPIDPSCRSGVAAVSAYSRHLVPPNESTFVLPALQRNSEFVMVHPLGWNVNRLILQGVMKWTGFVSTPSLLMQHKGDNPQSNRDLSYLQNADFPLILSNVQLPPGNSWDEGGFHQRIHFHTQTGIALIVIADNDALYGNVYSSDAVETTTGLLNFIERENVRLEGGAEHCIFQKDADPEIDALHSSYQAVYDMDFNGQGDYAIHDAPENHTTSTTSDTGTGRPKCWIPVILYYDNDVSLFDDFVIAMWQIPNRPAVILDAGNNTQEFQEPTLLLPEPQNSTKRDPSDRGIWIHSFSGSPDLFIHHQFTVNTSAIPPRVHDVSYEVHDMSNMPDSYKDDVFGNHIRVLRQLANEAIESNPIVGTSMAFPAQRVGDRVRCNAGECEAGDLITNALQWHAETDIAFVSSGGLRGNGWEAGKSEKCCRPCKTEPHDNLNLRSRFAKAPYGFPIFGKLSHFQIQFVPAK